MIDPSPAEHGARSEPARPALWTGLYTGALLILVMVGALVTANRFPWFDSRALERDAIAYSLFVIFMLIPVCRFLNRPLQMFTSAMVGWVVFLIAYDFAGMYFHNLFQVLRTPFEAMIEGTVVYGVCAVGSWVGAMILRARHHSIAQERRHANDVTPHHL